MLRGSVMSKRMRKLKLRGMKAKKKFTIREG